MTRDGEEEFLLEEPGAGDAEEITSVEPEEVLEEPGEAGEQEAEEHGEAGEGVLEYSVGPVTYLVGEELYRVVEPGLDPEIARAAEAVAEYMARHGRTYSGLLIG